MSSSGFAPLLGAPVVWILAVVALAILALYGWAARLRRGGRAVPLWTPLVLRLLAVLGIIIPGWAILRWYHDLQRARELTRSLPVNTELIAERFVVNSAALLSLGFLVLVSGIYLARRSSRRGGPGSPP